jgi:hypothetical protein
MVEALVTLKGRVIDIGYGRIEVIRGRTSGGGRCAASLSVNQKKETCFQRGTCSQEISNCPP